MRFEQDFSAAVCNRVQQRWCQGVPVSLPAPLQSQCKLIHMQSDAGHSIGMCTYHEHGGVCHCWVGLQQADDDAVACEQQQRVLVQLP